LEQFLSLYSLKFHLFSDEYCQSAAFVSRVSKSPSILKLSSIVFLRSYECSKSLSIAMDFASLVTFRVNRVYLSYYQERFTKRS